MSNRRGLIFSSASLGELLGALTERGRAFLRGALPDKSQDAPSSIDLVEVSEALLSRRGEATGVALAQTLLSGYVAAEPESQAAFLESLADRFGPDRARLEQAIKAYAVESSAQAISTLHKAAEPRRQELIRRLNLAPGGTQALVQMREGLLDNVTRNANLRAVDDDFVHLFTSWFNRGFLVLRRIDWTTPAHILEKIIRMKPSTRSQTGKSCEAGWCLRIAVATRSFIRS